MCGRFASTTPPDAVARRFKTAGPVPNAAPSWNVAPSQPAMVVRWHPESGERRLDLLTWGLVPHWTKDLAKARKPINARAETVATSPMFRDAFHRRRCIVPADAFYEWQATPDGKRPHAIARADGAMIAFAGLWESWRAPGDEVLRSFTILTTAANDALRPLHARMPVLIEPADWPLWLGETAGEPAALLRPSAAALRIWPVCARVNNVRNDGPDLLAPIDG